jgi:hypothetical protein
VGHDAVVDRAGFVCVVVGTFFGAGTSVVTNSIDGDPRTSSPASRTDTT